MTPAVIEVADRDAAWLRGQAMPGRARSSSKTFRASWTVANGALFNALAKLANAAGYDVVASKLNAVDFGVPQHRVRAIIVGTREGEPGYCYPMPTHWTLGRPADGKSWNMLSHDNSGGEDDSEAAEFDAEARRRNAPKPRETKSPQVEEQIGFLDDEAEA